MKKLQVLFLLMLSVNLCYSASKQTNMQQGARSGDGKIMVIHFEENTGTLINDNSGSGNNGTAQGTTAWVEGKFGSALQFDGSDGRVDIADSVELTPTSSGFSIAAWVKVLDGTNKIHTILSKWDNVARKEFKFTIGATGNWRNAITMREAVGGGYITRADNTRTIDAFDGKWHYIVGTYDGTTNVTGLKIYIDGEQVDDASDPGGTFNGVENTISEVWIGANFEVAEYFDGGIDEVVVWDREISQAEIINNYSAQIQGHQ